MLRRSQSRFACRSFLICPHISAAALVSAVVRSWGLAEVATPPALAHPCQHASSASSTRAQQIDSRLRVNIDSSRPDGLSPPLSALQVPLVCASDFVRELWLGFGDAASSAARLPRIVH